MLIPFEDYLDIENTLQSGQVFRWERIDSKPVNNPWFRGVIFGNLVEMGTSRYLFSNPKHPYTIKLISSIPIPDPRSKK